MNDDLNQNDTTDNQESGFADIDPVQLLHDLSQTYDDIQNISSKELKKKPGRKKHTHDRRYTVADHKMAYEVWRKTSNMRGTARILGCSWHLVNRWSKADYKCKYRCPWHGWQKLKTRDMLSVEEIANVDTKDLWQPIGQPTGQGGTFSAEIDVTDLIRTDKDRLLHLELLYNKLFFTATEIMLDCPAVKNASGKMTDEELRELFSRGAQTRSLDVAVRTLLSLIQEIDRLKEQAGLKRKAGKAGEVEKEIPKLEIEDLRIIKAALGKMDEKERIVLSKLWHSDIDCLHDLDSADEKGK